MKKVLVLIGLMIAFQATFAKKLDLKFNLKEGETYKQVMTSTSKVSQEIMGQKMDITIVMSNTTLYKVLKIVDGNYEMEVSYDKMSMSMDMPQGNVKFSSDDESADNPFSPIVNSMIGKKFNLTMSEKGHIIELTGIKELMDAVFSSVPGDQGQLKQMQEQLKGAFGEDAFKNSFEKMTAVFPEGKIKKGTEWDFDLTQNVGFTIDSKNTYKLIDFNKSVATIKGTSTMATPDSSSVMDMGVMKMKYDMSGDVVSEMKVDVNTGWIIEANMVQKLNGEISMEGQNIPEGLKLPMKMETTIQITD